MKQSSYLEKIYVVDALRTAIGATNKSLKEFSATQLGALVMKELLTRNHIHSSLVKEVILGNTVSAGLGQNLARQALCLAGIPDSVPGYTVNFVCGSGLQAIIFGIQSLACRQSGVILAGGTESASQSPYLIRRHDKEKKEMDSLINDGLWCYIANKHMGELAERIGENFNISRQEQDEFALTSHRKAYRAGEEGNFLKEIVPIEIQPGEMFVKDERPRRETSLERLQKLSGAFKEGGNVTAGNSCIPSDGAAVAVLATEDLVKQHGWKPKARILGYVSMAVTPEDVFAGSVSSIPRCIDAAGLRFKDIDLFEVVEAFAVQGVLTQKELKIPDEKFNIYGGDVALGHPLGTAGARALVTLIHALIQQKKKKGIVSVCLGGGGTIAMAVEVLD